MGTGSRREQRADSDRRIIAAARGMFTERGFEATTVRAVAVAAGVDAALVVRRFGGKEGLFLAALPDAWNLDHLRSSDSPEVLLDRWLDLFVRRVDQGEESFAVESVLRAALSRPAVAEQLRDDLFGTAARQLAAPLGDDAHERAQLAAAMLMSVTLARRVLRVEPLASWSVDDLVSALRPALAEVLGVGRRTS